LRALWVHELEAAGFAVSGTADGLTGIVEARRMEPALIVLDLLLPRMNGFSVARWVRQLPGGAEIAILAVSAVTSSALRREAIEAGCDAFLAKPVTGCAVVAEAARLLAERVERKRA
jgi:DNA-binding response OmpR family regulator